LKRAVGKAAGIDEQEGHHLPSRQTIHCFGDQAEIKEFWLKSYTASTVPLDIAPSAYYLFRSLQNNLDGQRFDSMGDILKYLEDFFAQKWFLRKWNYPEHWQKIVDQDGQYILD